MSLRKCITGRVGDLAFQEVFALIQWGPEEAVFSAHNGASEKVVHFSRERVLLLESPPAGACQVVEMEEARSRLCGAILEASSWHGALFEYFEGAPPASLAETNGVIELKFSATELLKGLGESPSPPPAPTSIPGAESDPLSAIQALVKLVTQAYSKRPLLEELASHYRSIGALRHAVLCLRQLASLHVEWGAPANACKVLEQAIQLCPADFRVVEELIPPAHATGQETLAEHVAQALCAQLEKLKLRCWGVQVCGLISWSPESPELKVLVGESRLKRGESKSGVRELWGAALALESNGKPREAEQACALILGADPGNRAARRKLQRLKWRRRASVHFKRWVTLAAGILLYAAWSMWDARSASAFESLKSTGRSMEPREAISLVRKAADNFPVTRYVVRIAELERELIDKCFEEEKRKLAAGLGAFERSELTYADGILREVCDRSLFPPLRDRAQAGRNEISERRKAVDKKLSEAGQHLKAHQYEKAFSVHQELLTAGMDPDTFASLWIPIRVETVPAGARLRIAGKDAGVSPSWILMPAERECKLEVLMPEFVSREILGPVWSCVERKDPTLRFSLLPEKLIEASWGGGQFATGLALDSTPVPVLGCDGVLRGFSSTRQRRWELTPDPVWVGSGVPCLNGKTLVIGSTIGKAAGYSVLRGTILWECTLSKNGGGVIVGPSYGAQVLATSSAGAVLINTETGRSSRQLDIPERRKFRFQGISGNSAVFVLEGGDLVGADLNTAKRIFEKRARFATAEWITLAGNQFLVGQADGNVVVSSLDGQAERWRKSFAGHCMAAFSSTQKLVVIGTNSGLLFGFQALTGEPVWQADLGSPITELTVGEVGDSRCLVAHTDRRGERVFVVVRLKDGKVAWEVPMGPTEASWASIDRQRVALSTPGGGVLVLKMPD